MSQTSPRLAFLLAFPCLIAACSGDDATVDSAEKASESTASTEDSPSKTPSKSEHSGKWPGAKDAGATEKELVRAVALSRRQVSKSLMAVADVISLDEVDVFPERTQPVIEIKVEEGDKVNKGQVLALLRNDVESLAVAEAEVRVTEAENEFQRSERDHQRNLSLMESEAVGATRLISQRELETSRQAVVTARTAWEAAKVSRDRSQLELQQTIMLAPIAGTVASREISLGDMANPSTRAFHLVDNSKPRAVFYRPQRELADLKVGQLFTASCEALPGRLLTGKIERIAPVVDVASGTVKITGALDTDRGEIPIGVLIRLELVLEVHPNALMVPKKAILFEGRELFAYVVRDGIAHKIRIDGGFEEVDSIEALASGDALEAGEQLVVVGADRLEDGDAVELAE